MASSSCGERSVGRLLDCFSVIPPGKPPHDRNVGRDREGTRQRVLSRHPRAASWSSVPLPGGWKAHQVSDQIAGWRQGAGGNQPLRPHPRTHHLQGAQCRLPRWPSWWQPPGGGHGGVEPQAGTSSCSIASLNTLRCFTPRHCCTMALLWNSCTVGVPLTPACSAIA